MESIKKVVDAAKKRLAEDKRTKELASTWRKEQAMKEKIAKAPSKKPTLGQKPKTHGNLFEAIKSRRDLPLKY